jgi:hypothetical protein
MKYILSIITILVFAGNLSAQQGGFVNNGLRLVIPENTKLDINGGQQAAYVNNENGTIELGGTFAIEGNWSNNSSQENIFTYYGPSAEVIFNGSDGQTIGDTTTTTWNALTISGNFHLSHDLTILNELKMEDGHIYLEDNNLIVNTGAYITPVTEYSGSNMVISNGAGKLVYEVTENGSYLFPMGSMVNGAIYSPVTIETTMGTYDENARLSAQVIPEKHPNETNQNNYLNRYWTLSQEGISNLIAEVSMFYDQSDVNGTDVGFYGMHWADQWYQMENVVNNEIFGTVSQLGDFTAKGQEVGLEDELDKDNLIYISNGSLFLKNGEDLVGAKVTIYNTVGQILSVNIYDGSEIMLSQKDSYCIVNIRKNEFYYSKLIFNK